MKILKIPYYWRNFILITPNSQFWKKSWACYPPHYHHRPRLKEHSVQAWFQNDKLGRVVRMVVGSILPNAKFGPNDHRKDAPPFTRSLISNFSKSFKVSNILTRPRNRLAEEKVVRILQTRQYEEFMTEIKKSSNS